MKKFIKKFCILTTLTIAPLTLSSFNKPTFAMESSAMKSSAMKSSAMKSSAMKSTLKNIQLFNIDDDAQKAMRRYITNANNIHKKITNMPTYFVPINLWRAICEIQKEIIENLKNLKNILSDLAPIYPSMSIPFKQTLNIFIDLSNQLTFKLKVYSSAIKASNAPFKEKAKEKIANLATELFNDLTIFNKKLETFINLPADEYKKNEARNKTMEKLINLFDELLKELSQNSTGSFADLEIQEIAGTANVDDLNLKKMNAHKIFNLSGSNENNSDENNSDENNSDENSSDENNSDENNSDESNHKKHFYDHLCDFCTTFFNKGRTEKRKTKSNNTDNPLGLPDNCYTKIKNLPNFFK